jgi:hypothetical protein
LVVFPETRRLDQWCAAYDQPEAIVAGFFLRGPYRPLGEVRIDGALVEHEPGAAPWGPVRGCVHVDDGVRIAPRNDSTTRSSWRCAATAAGRASTAA